MTATTDWGRFSVANDHIGRCMQNGHYEEDLIAKALHYAMDKGKIAVDIGANIGCHSVPYANAFEEVYAFEPNPEALKHLRKNVPKNVAVYDVALGAENGAGSLETPDPDNIGHTILTEGDGVRVNRLDDYNLKDVALIKVDVEGMELDVLKGAERTLEQKPVMVLEATEPEAIWHLLSRHRYRTIHRHDSKNYICLP